MVNLISEGAFLIQVHKATVFFFLKMNHLWVEKIMGLNYRGGGKVCEFKLTLHT